MKTLYPIPLSCKRHFLLFVVVLSMSLTAISQTYKGKDGSQTIPLLSTAVYNRYSALSAPATSGMYFVTVTDINQLSGSFIFTNSVNPYSTSALSRGDLVMIIQMQGADIVTTDDANYGAVTNLNNTGNYEVRTVFSINGNNIYFCDPLSNSYNQGGRAKTQVVRIPRLAALTINSGGTLTGRPWNGTVGGVIAVEANGNVEINGTISANAIGFQGGVDNKNSSSNSGSPAVTLYVSANSATTASKGESIAGNTAEYNASLGGAYGRGAPANGGGGGNGHNAGGGGGSNAGNNGMLTPWNGTGLKNISTIAWADAWNLEGASFASDVSVGAGRGGYTYANTNQNALTREPGASAWGGDRRQNVGGFGARPLDYSSGKVVFMGGGGGAGDGNNNSAGNGGAGGGIVYLLANGNVQGTGSINANGENGWNTQLTNIDAAGGAGGSGAILMNVLGTITTVSLRANGGVGGNQLLLLSEAEGPGGGGGGGYISTTPTTVIMEVRGGAGGLSQSALVTEFTPNGATDGAAGTITSRTFSEPRTCNASGFLLPIKLISFTSVMRGTLVDLNWVTENESTGNKFEIERSYDGQTFTSIGHKTVSSSTTGKSSYTHTDNTLDHNQTVVYYRLKMTESTGQFEYSPVRVLRLANLTKSGATFSMYPNPAVNNLSVHLPSNWLGAPVKLELFDISGKLARSVETKKATAIESINLNDMTKGFYIVKISSGGESFQQKMLKH